MARSRVVVLGTSGMLGQQVTREFSDPYPSEVLRVGRSGDVDLVFDFQGQSAGEIVSQIGLKREDWIINCIGWIPQKSVNPSEDERNAYLLNVDLPTKLNQLSESLSVRVLQVGTDCVFDGAQGGYNELSTPTPTDLYSQTKILGEREQSSAMILRASIIGIDSNSNSGLFSWFLSQMHKTSLNGYVDHYWNGVTTSAMAKIFRGIVELDAFNKGIHHLVPINLVSKYELLTMFQELLGAEVQVEPVGGPSGPKDRTLSTIEPEVSNRLWHIGGYANIPSILTLVEEMISDYRQRSVDAEK